MILEGATSIKAALEAKKRVIKALYVVEKKRDRNLNYILFKAHEAGVPIHRVQREEIDALALGKTHGGLLADVSERKMDELDIQNSSFLLVVEGVVDPFNFGYIVRTAYSAGVDGILMPEYHWHDLESVILKSSAGAFDHCPIIQSKDLAGDLKLLKQKGFTVYAGYRHQAIVYDEADYTKPSILCVGGELRGLSKQVLEQVNQAVYIPYANGFKNALNAASACSVFCFEVLRQRRHH
ncbi:RNA methyltransferase [Bulleidia sp. zg-1006]|uniref:TrmH family RNA methyltransferase n=1 Tax=Bulleidia sp. zg-1006 TaxID=2806552 RepID=UPI001939827B|nr:RNA methyltransferase [Bulleidia sp. zg-1006]QRG86208.1 RNA methyltransferase [Bulleidia sp. zg-1006]